MAAISPRILEILRQVEEAAGDLSEATTMPRECYVDSEWYEFEWESVFARSWLCLGRADCVKKPGDYYRVDIGDEPLVIVKDDDGKVRVLSAVCAHRGHIVCEGSGNCGRVLRCPLHYWSYGLDGRLITAPSMSETIPLKELKKEAHLPELKVEIWNGFLFVNMNPDAAPLAPTLWRLEKEMERYRTDELVTGMEYGTSFYMNEDQGGGMASNTSWNWKMMMENSLEPYHTAYIHMGLHDFAPVRYASFVDDWTEDEGAVYHPTGLVEIDGAFTPTGKVWFPVIPTLEESDRKRFIIAAIPPTLLLIVGPDSVGYHLYMPEGPQSHARRGGILYPPETLKLPMFNEMQDAQAGYIANFFEPDLLANESVMRGARSRLRKPGPRYSYQEETLVQFNRWLLKYYRAYVQETMANTEANV